MMPPKILPETTMVIGPSSVGKSTYIAHERTSGRIEPGEIHFAFEFHQDSFPRLQGRRLIHYNMFEPYLNNADNIPNRISDAPAMRRILEQGLPGKAIVPVVPKRLLTKRVLTRTALEPDLMNTTSAYPKLDIFDFISRIDIAEIYERWFSFLSEKGIVTEIITMSDCSYRHVPDMASAFNILNDDPPVAYSAAERVAALKGFDFPYHRVDGFEEVTSANTDRSGTLAAIRPHLSSGSILDIGCGLGAFCFALEREGFAPVIGTELKKDRFLAACAFREISGSKCKFVFQDILDPSVPALEADNVLMLNVLHHSQNPIAALTRVAALTRKVLILEFPLPTDEKFRNTFSGATVPPNMPFIGVSLLATEDQTFLFTEEALRRILVTNSSLFATVEFIASPMSPHRRIAIFHK